MPARKERNAYPAWRELPLATISRLRTQLDKEEGRGPLPYARQRRAVIAGARRQLGEAERACLDYRFWASRPGCLERIWANIRGTERDLILLYSAEELRARVPEVLHTVRRNLSEDSPHRQAVEKAVRRIGGGGRPIAEHERLVLARGLGIAYESRGARYRRVRVLANLLWIVTVAATLGIIGLAAWGYFDSHALDLCFVPDPPGDKVVCPTGEHPAPPGGMPPELRTQDSRNVVTGDFTHNWDVLTVEAAGLVGAAPTVVAAIRQIRDTQAVPYPFRLPLALAVLKFPLGALSALTGVLLIKAAFVPGLSNLDSSAQILGWAIVFGAAQHLVTHLVDQRAKETLSEVPNQSEPAAATGSKAEHGRRA
ncbi:hypothetical protein [Streptomyces sp. NPDC018693]|uniref:hypothetical protein n=1 Tax=unclassified Streptomyces TaxID=2593676 RepID=UPI003792F795